MLQPLLIESQIMANSTFDEVCDLRDRICNVMAVNRQLPYVTGDWEWDEPKRVLL